MQSVMRNIIQNKVIYDQIIIKSIIYLRFIMKIYKIL